MMVSVLETAVPYLSGQSTSVCVQAMSVLEHGIEAVAANGGAEREDGEGQVPLWPLLHACWAPLLRRLHDPRDAVVLRAAQLLVEVLCRGKTFMVTEPPQLLGELVALLRAVPRHEASHTHQQKRLRTLLACTARVAAGWELERALRRDAFCACADLLGTAVGGEAERALVAFAQQDAPCVWWWCLLRLGHATDADAARWGALVEEQQRQQLEKSSSEAALWRVAVACTEIDEA